MAAVTRASGVDEHAGSCALLSGLRQTARASSLGRDTRLVLDRLSACRTNRRGACRRSQGRIVVSALEELDAGQFAWRSPMPFSRTSSGILSRNHDRLEALSTFLMGIRRAPARGATIHYRRAASSYYRVDVRDTLPLDFSDSRSGGTAA